MPWTASILFIEANKVGKNTASAANRALSSDFVFRVCSPVSRRNLGRKQQKFQVPGHN
jgi:hypothetical protein